ncbi:hypothetical protein DYB32_005524 [Aphanomyces invadans]|uniref:MPN domain-containing protein n=1 Tax=Aphanomyces invadans TaxID=157072 RepID=A0A3R6VA16_9STRA|nr:hypothetical protein DYB32_005524 [Aphanomyces invadans]
MANRVRRWSPVAHPRESDKSSANMSAASISLDDVAVEVAHNAGDSSNHFNEGTSEGRVDVGIHPLVLMNLCDHWTRAAAIASPGNPSTKPVVGALFGVQKGREINVIDSFELPSALELSESDSNLTLKAFLTQRTEQFATVFPGFEFLGWYAVQSKIQASDLATHRTMMEFNESPLFLVLDPTPPPPQPKDRAKVKLPLALYESELHVVNNTPTMLFVKAPFKMTTTESEGIALDHISKVAPTNAPTQSSRKFIVEYMASV